MRSSSKNHRTTHKSKNILNYLKNNLSLNIGTIVFGAIFLYMIVSVFIYLTTDHISTYQVTAGPLAKNQTFVGLAIRSEEIVTANTGGYVTYYASDNARIKENGIVYGIGSTQNDTYSTVITDDVLHSMRNDMSFFASGFDTNNYNELYRFKYEINGKLSQNSSMILPAENMDSTNITVGNQTIGTADSDGLILYSMDGYEDFEPATITHNTFNSKNYHLENLKTKEMINVGEPIYRIIKDENWSVFIPLTDRQVIQVADRSSIRVKFLKDDVTQMADVVIHTSSDGSYYGELKFTTGVIRYSSDRFIEIELVTNTSTGLKIPVSSIVTKEFYTIPKIYATKGADNDDVGFCIPELAKQSDGKNKDGVVNPTIYEETEDVYYVDPNEIEAGTIIQQEASPNLYTVGAETATLEGVYCINKGYAVFRKIIIIEKNDEYCIVKTQTPFGLAQFDHIVEIGSTVNEQEILY